MPPAGGVGAAAAESDERLIARIVKTCFAWLLRTRRAPMIENAKKGPFHLHFKRIE
jgi:hypothetical protein